MTMRIAAIFAFLCALAFAPARAEELITSYVSDITVNRDASLTIRETMTFNVEGVDIRRGIVRAYPTTFENGNGDIAKIGVEVESVTRNAEDEPYVVSDLGTSIEIRIGRADLLLPHGLHTYVITYRATSVLAHTVLTDDLYYNVVGFDTPMKTAMASATIRLPDGARPQTLWVSAGPAGLVGSDATIEETSPGVVDVRATRALGPNEGITIRVVWSKGFVDRASPLEEPDRAPQ